MGHSRTRDVATTLPRSAASVGEDGARGSQGRHTADVPGARVPPRSQPESDESTEHNKRNTGTEGEEPPAQLHSIGVLLRDFAHGYVHALPSGFASNCPPWAHYEKCWEIRMETHAELAAPDENADRFAVVRHRWTPPPVAEDRPAEEERRPYRVKPWCAPERDPDSCIIEEPPPVASREWRPGLRLRADRW